MFFMSSDELMHPFGMLRPTPVDHTWKPSRVEMAPKCPRCDSANTKFCYYNNYSLTQPRYFCKACRRYWTKGGSLRNVPVGAGCRKNRRRGKSSAAARPLLSSRGPSTCTATTNNSENYNYSRQMITTTTTSSMTLRPDLALDDMVGSSHQPMVPPLPEPSSSSSSSPRDASTIDLAALYSKFLMNHCPETSTELQESPGRGLGHGQFVPELADGAGDSYVLIGSDGLGGGQSEGEMGELSYDPFDVVVTSAYESSFGTGAAFPGLLSSWKAPELQPGLCPFPGTGCDWSSLDQPSFGAF